MAPPSGTRTPSPPGRAAGIGGRDQDGATVARYLVTNLTTGGGIHWGKQVRETQLEALGELLGTSRAGAAFGPGFPARKPVRAGVTFFRNAR